MPISRHAIDPARTARLSGALYLLIAICGAFSIAYVPSVITVPSDAAATAELVAENGLLLGAGILADVVVIVAEIILTTALYLLLRPAGETLARVAAVARLAMVAVMAFNLMTLVRVWFGADGAAGAAEQTLALLNQHALTIYVWQLFFAAHMAALGMLVWRSNFLPKTIGLLIGIGSAGYLIDASMALSGAQAAGPELTAAILLVIAVIGELGLAFWLLFRGVATDRWHNSLPVAA